MHDQTIEERLRNTLRSEADQLPFTVTPDELQRRLALRQRERAGRRVGLLAAGIAGIVIGGVFLVAVNPFRGNQVATTPQPTTAPSAQPTARVAEPLGAVGQAVLVRPVGANPERPDAFEVSLLDPIDKTSEVIATIPGSVIPEDGWLDGAEGPPAVSRTGYLAIPFSRGPNIDDMHPAIVIADVRTPTANRRIVDGFRDPEWGPSEQLIARTWPVSEDHVVWGPTGESRAEPMPDGVDFAGWSPDDGARFIGTLEGAWGSVDFNGRFTPMSDLPAAYQRTGRERPAGVATHTLGMGCDSGATGGGCILGEWASRDEPPIRSWFTASAGATAFDHVWAVDGQSVILLLRHPATVDRQRIELVYAASPDARSTIGALDAPSYVTPAILGISAEPAPGHPAPVAVGDSTGQVFAFVLGDGTVRAQDGTAWFAGWADDPAPYDPD